MFGNSLDHIKKSMIITKYFELSDDTNIYQNAEIIEYVYREMYVINAMLKMLKISVLSTCTKMLKTAN